MHTQYIYDNKRIYDNLLHPEHSEAWTEDLRRELNGTLLPCETGFFWMVLFFFLCSTELFFLCSTQLYCRVRQGFLDGTVFQKVQILRSKLKFCVQSSTLRIHILAISRWYCAPQVDISHPYTHGQTQTQTHTYRWYCAPKIDIFTHIYIYVYIYIEYIHVNSLSHSLSLSLSHTLSLSLSLSLSHPAFNIIRTYVFLSVRFGVLGGRCEVFYIIYIYILYIYII